MPDALEELEARLMRKVAPVSVAQDMKVVIAKLRHVVQAAEFETSMSQLIEDQGAANAAILGDLEAGQVLGQTTLDAITGLIEDLTTLTESIATIAENVEDIIETTPFRLLLPEDGLMPFNAVQSVGGVKTANDVVAYPFTLAKDYTITQIRVECLLASGNCDAGVYTSGGTKVVSHGAKTCAVGALTFDISDTPLSKGLYYATLSVSNTTAQFRSLGFPTTDLAVLCGIKRQATAYPLPSTLASLSNIDGPNRWPIMALELI